MKERGWLRPRDDFRGMTMSRKNLFKGIAGLLMLAAAAWVVAYETREDDAVWARVQRGDLVLGVDFEGELAAVESEQLGPPNVQSAFNLKLSWMASEGAEVEAGAPVLRFDTTELQQRLQEVRVDAESAEKTLEKRQADLEVQKRGLDLQLAEAQANLRKAEFKLKVPEEVAQSNELKKARIDKQLAELEIASIESQIEQAAISAQAQLNATRRRRDRALARIQELEENIEKMAVKASRAGTVTYVSNWRGEKKKIGDMVWRGDKVIEIPDLQRMLADAEVAEADAGRLTVGQSVTFRLDAHPDREYHGKVRLIRRSVQQKSWRNPKKVVRMVVELDKTDPERMRPGMRLRGTVETDRRPDTLLVPENAVFAQPDGAVVYVKTLWGQREVRPSFGERNKESFGVLEGLNAGDRVLTRGSGDGA